MGEGSNGKGTADTHNRGETLTGRARSLQNLKHFSSTYQPPHNPGRPRKDHLLIAELRRALRETIPGDKQKRTCYRLICQSIVRKAIRGDVDAAKLVFDRLLGRVKDAEEFERPTDVIVRVVTNQPRDFDREGEDGSAF